MTRASASALRTFVPRAAMAILMLALVACAWHLRQLLLLLFGAVLFAIALRAGAGLIRKRFGLSEGFSLFACILVLAALLGFGGWLFGAQLVNQTLVLQEKLPQAWASARDWLQHQKLGAEFLNSLEANAPSLASIGTQVKRATVLVSDAVLALLLLGFGSIYLAVDPATYRDGALQLVPPSCREQVAAALDECAITLKHWLLSQLVVMVIVGSLAGIGLWLVGVPAPLALGVLMAVLEFVPFAGPIIAAVPGILLAFTGGPTQALSALAVYVVVQQLESNVVAPIIARRMLRLPPALVLFSVVAFGAVFGPLGFVFAMPLTVSLVVLVKRLYVDRGRQPEHLAQVNNERE